MRKKFYTALSFYHTEIGMAVVEKFYDSDLNSARFYELFTPFDESFISFEILIVACTASDSKVFLFCTQWQEIKTSSQQIFSKKSQ